MKVYIAVIAIILSSLPSIVALSTVNCDFEKIASTYVCNPASVNPIVKENQDIQVNGTHLSGLGNEDVSYVRFNSPLTLQYVPTKLFEIFENIEIFGLQNVNLMTLTSQAFSNCYKLKSLHIDGNKKLTEIPAGFAEDCGNVENLYMPGNAIKTIDKEAFKGLQNLNYLVLTKNDIEELNVDVFNNLGQLQHLFLDQNKIKIINNDLFYPLRKLQLLSITQNQIEEISAEIFRNNPLLDQIFLDDNKIVAIDAKFFDEFPGTREEYEYRFHNNNCTNSSVSSKIEGAENFSDFEMCFLAWNKTHHKQHEKEEFSTDNDVIPFTEATTEAFTAQNEFYISDCRYFLNENRKYTCVLENVDLVLKMIGGSHYGDFGDGNVTQLFFFNSILSKVPPIVFQKFPNLEFLSVANTQMTIINDQTFDDCGKLQKIDASGNNIIKIVETSLKNCKNLKTIDVSGNPIEYVDGEIFYYDPQLKHIILHRNF